MLLCCDDAERATGRAARRASQASLPGQRAARPAAAASASLSVRLPSYSDLPIMHPATPVDASRRTSSAVVTPPDAMTGTATADAISAIACTFGPAIIPSFAMSV